MNETLRRGDRGSPVSSLQSILDARGYDLGSSGVDGHFGAATLGAVLQFQQAEGLDVDGVVGPATWKALLDMEGAPDSEARFVLPSDGSPGARAVLAALDDVGKKEVPNGSNGGPELDDLVGGYRDYWKSGGSKDPAWCGIACSVWTARALGLGHRGDAIDWTAHPFSRWRGSTIDRRPLNFSLLLWAEERDALLPAGGPAPVGSIFLMVREGSGSDTSSGSAAGHCGIVVADHGETVETVEGNVSNRVVRRTRKKSELSGFVQWWG